MWYESCGHVEHSRLDVELADRRAGVVAPHVSDHVQHEPVALHQEFGWAFSQGSVHVLWLPTHC